MAEQLPDPTGGWAEATGKVADATSKLTGAFEKLGAFVTGPGQQVMGMLSDHLKVVRWERQVRLCDRVQKLMTDRGMTHPTRTLPINVALPLLDRATLEESDDLQDIWAQMLVNAGDAASDGEMRRAYIGMLEDLTAFDVLILAKIAEAETLLTDGKRGVWTGGLPEHAEPHRDGVMGPNHPSEQVAISVSNLIRAGCLFESADWSGPNSIGLVGVTPIGRAFIRACTAPANRDPPFNPARQPFRT